jgi:HlyD family secretion protein
MLNLFKNKKIRNWGIVVAVMLALLLVAQTFKSASADVPLVSATGKVVSLEVADTIETSGSLDAQPFAALNWKTSGVVEKVNVKPGDFVKAGDILVTLQPESTSANIVSAQADLVTAQKNLEDLLNSGTDLAQAVINLRDAQETYDDAANWRAELNDKITIQQIKYVKVMGRTVPKMVEREDYADAETIAKADEDLALAKAKLEDAQREYNRLKDGPNSQDVLAAQARVDAAQVTVNSMYIIAPFDGEVLSVDHAAGDQVNAGDVAVYLADMNHLYVEAQVDESDVATIKVGQQADVTLDALTGVTFTGKVTSINPVGEVVSGLVKYNVRIDLDKVTDQEFIPLGTTANVTIHVKDAMASLAVPITTVQNDAKGEFVMVQQKDGSARRVDVVSGAIVGDMVVVSGDLQEGDSVLTSDASSFQAPNMFRGGGS